MRTLRSKLFIDVGLILIVVAVLNDLLPEFSIRKKVDKMATFLGEHIESIEDRLRHFASFFVLYNLIEGAVDLDGMSILISTRDQHLAEYPSPWNIAGEIVSYNPQISFLRLHGKDTVDIKMMVKDAPLHSPQIMPYEQGMFLAKIPGKSAYIALPTEKGSFFLFDLENLRQMQEVDLQKLPDPFKDQLLFTKKNLPENPKGSWQTLQAKVPPFAEDLSSDAIWKFLFWNEGRWLEKIGLIQEVCRWHSKSLPIPLAGVLKINLQAEEGAAILSDELILTRQGGVEVPLNTLKLGLLPYALQPDCEILKKIELPTPNKEELTIGFSISGMVRKMARLSRKPIILTWDGPPLGYTADGDYFDPVTEGFPFKKVEDEGFSFVSWRGDKYAVHEINLQNVRLTLLTPEIEALATKRFLAGLKHQLTVTLTMSLLGATLISFGMALALLRRTARKITEPIALLSHAAETLGLGKYEDVQFPKSKSDTEEVALLIDAFEKMVIALKDRDKIRGVLNKVVSSQVSEELLSHSIELGGEEKQVTMLFSDIRNFTHSAEHLDPQVLIRRLNSYLTCMCQVIDQTKGVVDKFVGDEIMALYGVPLPMENHPIQAIIAGLMMIEELKKWNLQEGEPKFEIGIGIHTGTVCVGNMGAENRQNYTVIGANVNLAARLCAYAKPMQIIISEETRQATGVEKAFKMQALPPATLKGIDHPVPIYEVLGRL